MRERLLGLKIVIAGLVVAIIILVWGWYSDRADQRTVGFREGANASISCTNRFTLSILHHVPEDRASVAWMYCMEEKAKVAGYEWR